VPDRIVDESRQEQEEPQEETGPRRFVDVHHGDGVSPAL